MTYYITSVKFLCYKIFTVIEITDTGYTVHEVMDMKLHTNFLRRLAVSTLLLCSMVPTVCAAAPAYTMTIADGFIAVWDHGAGDWYLRSAVPAAMLTEQDRQLLQQGLELPGSAALTRALEDFCS